MVGGHRSGRSPLLLTFAGRVHADSGLLKVDGLVAPVRASAIRGRVAVARMARAADPVAELGAALDSGAPIVAIDDLDAVADPQHRRGVAFGLAEAHRAGTTLLVTCLDPAALDGLLPDPEHAVLLEVTRAVEVSR